MAALIRRAEIAGASAVVLRRGDARAGAVLVKAYDTRARTARLFSESVDAEGQRLWIEPLAGATEPELDAFAERQVAFDPDLWRIEIEDREGRHFLTEPLA